MSASAATVDTHVFSSSFDGTGSVPAGAFEGVGQVATHHASGRVYVLDTGHHVVAQFDAAGNPLPFTSTELAPGSTSLTGMNTPLGSFDFFPNFGVFQESDIAVDNSGGPNDGRIYVVSGAAKVLAFSPSGDYLFQLPPPGTGENTLCGAASDSIGHLWLSETNRYHDAFHFTEFSTSGIPPSPIGGFDRNGGENCDITLDSSGRLFAVSRYFGKTGLDYQVDRYSPTGEFEGTVEPDIALPSVDIDPSTDHLLAGGGAEVREYDDEGLLSTFGVGELGNVKGVAGAPNGDVYVTDASKGEVSIYAPGTTTAPDASIDPPSDIELETATFTGTVNPLGFPTNYRFEYRFNGSTEEWKRTSTEDAGNGTADVPVLAEVEDLEAGAKYEVRLFVVDTDRKVSFRTPVELFTMDPVPPVVETIGWPYRTSTSVNLAARINPRNTQTTYYFEYGPTDSYGSKLPATEDGDAGEGKVLRLVLQEIKGLDPGTTIHYRVIASNVAGTVTGEDQTIKTRLTDEIPGHGRVPGPPGSDRGYEQINLPDTNGNPAGLFSGASSDGNKVLYTIGGGTAESEGGAQAPYVASRTEAGWVSTSIQPPRTQADVFFYDYPATNPDLSKVVNFAGGLDGVISFWELSPDGSARTVGDTIAAGLDGIAGFGSSQDLSTHIAWAESHLYELTATGREQVDIMPDGSPAPCGPLSAGNPDEWAVGVSSGAFASYPERYQIASDGSYFLFNVSPDNSCGPTQLYIRHEGSAGTLASGQTELVSGPVVSGPEWPALFAGATPAGPGDPEPTVFLWTKSRLTPEDEEQPDNGTYAFSPPGGDLYSYDVASKDFACLTCVVPHADVVSTEGAPAHKSIAVAHDGSKLYFSSSRAFFEGQGIDGASNIYRYDAASEELAFVATQGEPGGAVTGVGVDSLNSGQALSEDGSVLTFRSSAPSLNPLTGSDNGGFQQYYRYDDDDRSVVCISCPKGEEPKRDVLRALSEGTQRALRSSPVSADGDVYFTTIDPLLPADQNTANPAQSPDSGTDIYEWRDGQLLLITDGITSHAAKQAPVVVGSTASGRDVYFKMTARLTPDVTDGFAKLYDARIGGGFDFPPPPPPCSLDACQGEAKGPPEDVITGSSKFAGSGNPKPNARKRAKARCKAKQRHGKAGKESRRTLRKCQGKAKSRANKTNAKHG